LRVFSEILTSTEIETILGLEATRTFLKGDPIFGRDKGGKKIKVGIRQTSAWILSSPSGGDSNLADHLRRLLDVINPKADELKRLFTKCKIDIFCGFGCEGQGGFTLNAEIINRLAKLNLNLDFDIYPLSMDRGSEMPETF